MGNVNSNRNLLAALVTVLVFLPYVIVRLVSYIIMRLAVVYIEFHDRVIEYPLKYTRMFYEWLIKKNKDRN